MTGQRVGEYLLDEKLGQGTFGQVWRARHHVWADRIVAIKIPTDPQYLRALQREGWAVHGLVHPNIVRAIGFDPYADPPYLAMEYVPGCALRKLIGHLTINEAVSILMQVLTGLNFAHGRGIVHGDVKPENVLVNEGVAKLTDFGLGRPMPANSAGSIVYTASLGSAGKIAGTMEYMAPEVRIGARPDQRADLYACGVMLFEMLTGERPAGTELPSDLNADVPGALDEVFRRLYCRIDRRYASASDVHAALNRTTISGPPLLRSNCPRCCGSVEAGDQYCMHCGLRLAMFVRRCAKCGAYPDIADRYCVYCQHELVAKTA